MTSAEVLKAAETVGIEAGSAISSIDESAVAKVREALSGVDKDAVAALTSGGDVAE